ncbi:bifunctional adenosylcobinamide kinase/adenosylcobinamide-phosphate guanylyltransferase [Pseudobutyrivibrio sp.]|uniref:bifunctional adenosylcobinamide kinase/adenosylcobinamide-phosphate guanylyltransferase n=1 Tax=Pseudobutyrivibrio sp. TaxID=2014367 RepID=UPI001D69E95E|nr:bifunctional adenosylcobinamide kinase/adenosylcobinamide-phosphate guanylyltransferase [Pseudobutyrivibrio sp.]MBE5911302.1 hypothetical protein [Pseudobutyrivibrio sp.]
MILIVGGSYQGKTKFARNNFPECRYFNQLHLFIKKRLQEEKKPIQILTEIKDAIGDGQWVIISDEVGNGVVPIEQEDREYRDITGKILIELADEAEEVYRVVCGIGQRIK